MHNTDCLCYELGEAAATECMEIKSTNGST